MCIYIINFSEELTPSFASSAAPPICKSQKTAALLFQEEECVRETQAHQGKVRIRCASGQKILILVNLIIRHAWCLTFPK